MDESEVFDILRQIGCRVSAAAHIIRTSRDGDDIRGVLPTLIEDTAEDVQRLVDDYCIDESAPLDGH